MESASKVTTTIMLPPELRGRLDDAAAMLDRSRSWLAGRAIGAFLDSMPVSPPSAVVRPAQPPSPDRVVPSRTAEAAALTPSADGWHLHAAQESESLVPSAGRASPCRISLAGVAAGPTLSSSGPAAVFSETHNKGTTPMADPVVEYENAKLRRETEIQNADMREARRQDSDPRPPAPSGGAAETRRFQEDFSNASLARKRGGNPA